MIALDYLTAIRFSGTDAGDFLHNQLSSDVLALADGESVFACYCEPKGRVLALMLVCRVDEDYNVIMSRALATTVSVRLRMFVMRSKVNIEVLDDTRVAGLREHDKSGTTEIPVISIPLAGNATSLSLVSRDSFTDGDTSLCDAWKASELDQGICWLCPHTSAQFLPQMLGFDQLGAVNFRKGCYPGQEIVARTHYLGKVKRHPRLLKFTAQDCGNIPEKIQILTEEKSFDAIVVDRVCLRDKVRAGTDREGALGYDRVSMFVITRLDPDLIAKEIEFQGQVATLT